MTLSELITVWAIEGCNFYDKTVDGGFYLELSEINDQTAQLIEVVKIGADYITCNFTNFIKQHKSKIKKYLLDNFYDGELRTYLINQLCNTEHITDDGGEAVYYFLENDMMHLLMQ